MQTFSNIEMLIVACVLATFILTAFNAIFPAQQPKRYVRVPTQDFVQSQIESAYVEDQIQYLRHAMRVARKTRIPLRSLIQDIEFV